MNLRRPLRSRIVAGTIAMLLLGFFGYLVVLQFGDGSVAWRIYLGVICLGVLAAAAAALANAFGRFQVDVDLDGWAVRNGRYRCDLRWTEISAVVIQHREYNSRGRRLAPALYLVPEPGVSLDTPSERQATVDGRPAIWLFDLDDGKIDQRQLVRDLKILAGDRLEVRIYPLSLGLLSDENLKQLNKDARNWLDGKDRFTAFPGGAEGARTQRWLYRRRFVLFACWYLLVVLPVLVLINVAAGLHELLGILVAMLGLAAVAGAYSRFVARFSDAADLVDDESAIFGTQLRGTRDLQRCNELHAGLAVVLPPGTKRGFGKAWLLGFPHPAMLLGDPRTGRLRGQDELRALSAVLHESPHEADRVAARHLDSLATQSQVSEPVQADGSGSGDLWTSVTRAGRVVAWAVVVGSIALTGGSLVDSTRLLGSAILVGSVPLVVVWVGYSLFRIGALIGALWRAIRRTIENF